jgi:2-(1,2-epoxy-1,2-dihydrophenyl)acetyl-CoA isomerase
MGYETITVEHLDGVARVTLDRPDRLNALSGPMFLELERFTQEVDQSSDTRVVVVTGRGRAFCSGADLRSYTDEVDMADPQIRDRMRMIARVVRAWRHLDVPTIAAVNGVAYGGGANLALMCDLVIMHEDATMRTGMVPDMAATYLVPRLVGPARAAELLLLGDALSAREAERIGLVNRAVPGDRFDGEVREMHDGSLPRRRDHASSF